MSGMANRVFRREREWRHGYVGVALHTYQVTLGVTFRWYLGQPHFRLYVGPVKVYAGIFAADARAPLSGGDR